MFETLGSSLDQLLRSTPLLLGEHWSSLIWMASAFYGISSFARMGSY